MITEKRSLKKKQDVKVNFMFDYENNRTRCAGWHYKDNLYIWYRGKKDYLLVDIVENKVILESITKRNLIYHYETFYRERYRKYLDDRL